MERTRNRAPAIRSLRTGWLSWAFLAGNLPALASQQLPASPIAAHGFDIVFPREYMRAALLVSLVSVWVLVGLFYYLNRYTRRHYFTIWTAAWLFYALWLTIGVAFPNPPPAALAQILRLWCLSISAVFLLWGSVVFLDLKARPRLFGLFIGFLLTWTYAGHILSEDRFYLELPIFILIGLASMVAGLSFYRLRRHRQFVAAGLLFLGFSLWGIYLLTYPVSQEFATLVNAGFLFSAVLQLFVAVSMIVLVLEEARHINEQILAEIRSINSEKRELQAKILSTEEQCRSLFNQARLREELQAAYDEVRQTQQSVVQQERLLALGQMASGIAHDINNALSPIVAFSDLILKKEANLSPNSRKNLGHIRTAAEDIAQMVARLREFYRRREQQEQLRLLRSDRLIQQVIELTSPCWRDIPQGRGQVIRVETRFAQALPEIYGKESELREALTNIILNAVDALPQGGLIAISARQESLASWLPDQASANYLVVEITDDGIGMSEATRQRCLEPFFSTKRQSGGSGLGLAMVYGTMERHEGRIEVESQLNKGTTIRLIFPLRQSPATSVTAVLQPAQQLAAPLRVLCIDDEPLLRELVRETLEFYHHEVETAEGGQSGLEIFRKAKSAGRPFDVVITDLGMPGINGYQVAETIKGESPPTPVILLTGWGTTPEDKGERMAKIDALLGKPVRAMELIDLMAKVAGQAKPESPAVSPITSMVA